MINYFEFMHVDKPYTGRLFPLLAVYNIHAVYGPPIGFISKCHIQYIALVFIAHILAVFRPFIGRTSAAYMLIAYMPYNNMLYRLSGCTYRSNLLSTLPNK